MLKLNYEKKDENSRKGKKGESKSGVEGVAA
jgi:hypothetical protein